MADNRSVWAPPPPPHRTLALTAFLVCIWLVDSAGVALGQRWRQEPGRLEFTGKMVVRPLQVEHWMERGLTREEAQVRYQRAVQYTVDTIGEHVYRYHERMDEYWFHVPPGRSENDIGEQLIATGYYRYVCPNWKTSPQGILSNVCPDDEYFGEQWHHKRIESCAAWQIHTSGHDDVVIGVVDTGMRVTHEDLSNLNQYRRLGYDVEAEAWEGQGGSINDFGVGHGTRVLGIAAATGNNTHGVSGIGWSLRHRMLKSGESSDEEVLLCFWTSAGAGDRVICSTAGNALWDEGTWQLFADNTEYIREAFPNTLICQAAGNYYWRPTYPPFPDMIVVGGTDKSDKRFIANEQEQYGSVVGAMIDVMAPAVDIFSTQWDADDSYGSPQPGTSFATPQVAGLCALIWSYDPDLTASEVEALLYAGCDEHTEYNSTLHGHGRINAFNSLALASGSLWTRDPHPGLAGEDNIFKAAGAEEGRTIRFYYGTETGETEVSGCGSTVVVGIANASILGTAVAGSNGAALIEDVPVPGGWANTTVYLQAVELTTCRVSNLVTYTFPSN